MWIEEEYEYRVTEFCFSIQIKLSVHIDTSNDSETCIYALSRVVTSPRVPIAFSKEDMHFSQDAGPI